MLPGNWVYGKQVADQGGGDFERGAFAVGPPGRAVRRRRALEQLLDYVDSFQPTASIAVCAFFGSLSIPDRFRSPHLRRSTNSRSRAVCWSAAVIPSS
jgi:hypothetical protein